jgi:hypothetical protein
MDFEWDSRKVLTLKFPEFSDKTRIVTEFGWSTYHPLRSQIAHHHAYAGEIIPHLAKQYVRINPKVCMEPDVSSVTFLIWAIIWGFQFGESQQMSLATLRKLVESVTVQLRDESKAVVLVGHDFRQDAE